MCRNCYVKRPDQRERSKLYRAERNQRPATEICIRCGQLRNIHARQMCRKCYRKTPRVRGKTKRSYRYTPCVKCYVSTVLEAYGMCGKCHDRESKRLADMRKEPRRCVKCQQVKKIHGRGMCDRCYRKDPGS